MKKTLAVLLFIFIPFFVQSQSITEKLICKIDNVNDIDVYSVKFDEKTGSYIYVMYDSTKELRNSILSNKGNSGDYDYINAYGALFDSQGNYYIVVDVKINDSTYRNILLRNGKEIYRADYINTELLENKGMIYTICTENNKSCVLKYDVSSGNFSKGSQYDEIYLCKFDKMRVEGEPIGRFGFTKDNKMYYLAKNNGEAFLVVGDKEHKHYSDIDPYTVLKDKSDKFSYVAKDTGSFMNYSAGFVVQGNKAYKTYYSVNNLILDDDDNVIYIAGDESESTVPQRLMKGDKAISKTYSGGIYNLEKTPSGKIYFIATEKKKNSEDYESFVVMDGKEGKRYPSINNLQILDDDEVVFTVQDNNGNSYAVYDNDEIKVPVKQSFLSVEKLKDGSKAYVTAEYGNYDLHIKDKYYIYLNKKRLGPYDGVMVLNYDNQNYFVSDEDGNYAYVVYKISPEYDYQYIIFTNKGKGMEFDNISDVYIYDGKPIFTTSTLVDKVNYSYKYKLYYGDKPITPEYDNVGDFNFNKKTGTATYVIAKNGGVYKVNIKF